MTGARAPVERRSPDELESLRLVALVLADALAINVSFAAAWWLRYEAQLGGAVSAFNRVSYQEYFPWGLVLTGVLLVTYRLEGLYRRRRRLALADALYNLTTGTIVGVALLTLAIFGLRPLAQSRLMLPYAAVLIVASLGMIRWIDILWTRRQLKRGVGAARTLLVGAGEVGRAVMRNVLAEPDSSFALVGFLDDNEKKRIQAIGRFEPLGRIDDLPRVLEEQAIDDVIVSLPWDCRDKITWIVSESEARGVRARIVPDLFQMTLHRVDLDSLNGIPLIGVRESALQGWHYGLKRLLDITLSSLVLVLTIPLLVAIAAAIRLSSPGPILFRQARVGRDGRLFTLYKFRSMTVGSDSAHAAMRPLSETTGPIFKMRRDPRVTRIGRLIRRLSLDELPQLWNVLRGEMSLVGPRPPMPTEVAEYEEWHRRRLDISPGMTGLWQVSGRSELTFDEMVMLDLFYAENWSLGLDVRILLRTVPTVLLGRGAY
jgi:exopolysaccharide biosynthesis polyprenyl glycosylphosphotransferase